MKRFVTTAKRNTNGRSSALDSSDIRNYRYENVIELKKFGYQKYKRALEFLLIVMLSPFILFLGGVTYLLVKLESRGPALIKQKRMGWNTKTFLMYKFRSMTETHNEDNDNFYSSDKITPIGRFIRKHRFDELPQIWNVIKGDMSLIGPRPDILSYFNQCVNSIPNYAKRYTIKPGITGWAQIHYGHCFDVDGARVRLKYDIDYINNMSFFKDLVIIYKTLLVIANGKGGR